MQTLSSSPQTTRDFLLRQNTTLNNLQDKEAFDAGLALLQGKKMGKATIQAKPAVKKRACPHQQEGEEGTYSTFIKLGKKQVS